MSDTGILTAPPAALPDWASQQVNLADPRLGAQAISCSDDFFAPMERMLQPSAAIFVPGKYDDNGKWMDGWESRRRRNTGHDWCVVRLAWPGQISGVDIDTSFFTGNYPPAASIDGCPEGADPEQAENWETLLPATALQGNQHHLLEFSGDSLAKSFSRSYSHVRLNMLPDGGVARLRVYGRPTGAAKMGEDGLIELSAAINGGYPVTWNDAHFGSVSNLILPGRGVDMSHGWETRRRREPGFDWCIIALGRPGSVKRIEVDTANFKGNYPDRCSIQAGFIPGITESALVAQAAQFWPTLLPEVKLEADKLHYFSSEIQPVGPITHVRFNLHPDGGVSRLRLWGKELTAEHNSRD